MRAVVPTVALVSAVAAIAGEPVVFLAAVVAVCSVDGVVERNDALDFDAASDCASVHRHLVPVPNGASGSDLNPIVGVLDSGSVGSPDGALDDFGFGTLMNCAAGSPAAVAVVETVAAAIADFVGLGFDFVLVADLM